MGIDGPEVIDVGLLHFGSIDLMANENGMQRQRALHRYAMQKRGGGAGRKRERREKSKMKQL